MGGAEGRLAVRLFMKMNMMRSTIDEVLFLLPILVAFGSSKLIPRFSFHALKFILQRLWSLRLANLL
jgi:hypothetical protein